METVWANEPNLIRFPQTLWHLDKTKITERGLRW